MNTLALPEPAVVSCFFDDRFQPHLPAMCLDWQGAPAARALRAWRLPDGLHLLGRIPERFGIEVRRRHADGYAVRLLWDDTRLTWPDLGRRHLRGSELADLLAAMGTDLDYLLDQPVEGPAPGPRRLAG
jgi:hypothetical protein